MEVNGRGDLVAAGARDGGLHRGNLRGEERVERAGDEAAGVHGPVRVSWESVAAAAAK